MVIVVRVMRGGSLALPGDLVTELRDRLPDRLRDPWAAIMRH